MVWYILLPLSLGVAAVVQSGINRRIMNLWGLTSAVSLNCLVLLVTMVVLGLAVQVIPKYVPEIFHFRSSKEPIYWWYILPGLFGFAIVAGLPVTIAKIGATRAFIIVIAAQLISSLIWDWRVESVGVSGWRIAGCVLAIVGAGLTLVQK